MRLKRFVTKRKNSHCRQNYCGRTASLFSFFLYFFVVAAIIIRKCNLRVAERVAVRHSPWLTKLTHKTTTHETTEAVNVRLSANKRIIFSTVNASKHPGVVSAATGRASVFPATLEKHCCFYFDPITSWFVWGLSVYGFLHLDSPGGRSYCAFGSVGRAQRMIFFCLRITNEDLRCVINFRK